MSILIIGGDQISQISSMLTQMGAKTINHWDARKKSSAPKKKVPQDTDCAYAGTIRTASRFTSGHSAGVDSDS